MRKFSAWLLVVAASLALWLLLITLVCITL